MSEQHDRLRTLLSTQRFGVLSTRQEDGRPYASLVAFAATADLTRLVFATLRTTRKHANLVADGRVAFLVDDRENRETDLQRASALTALGSASEARGAEHAELSGLFLARQPEMADFLGLPDCAVMRLDVQTYLLVSRFQRVVELRVQDGQLL